MTWGEFMPKKAAKSEKRRRAEGEVTSDLAMQQQIEAEHERQRAKILEEIHGRA